MSGSIQVLRGDLVLSGEQDRLMAIVLSESDRLNGTIEDFLPLREADAALRARGRPQAPGGGRQPRWRATRAELDAGQSIAVRCAFDPDGKLLADPD